MKKIKYYYNTHTLRYEKLVTPLRVKLLRVFGFIATALVTSVIISYFAFRFVGSPTEKILHAQNEELKDRFHALNQEVKSMQDQMGELERRDNTVYRSIFEADPIPDSARAKTIETQKELAHLASINDDELSVSIQQAIANLGTRMKVQARSYKELDNLLRNKELLLAATPAIQPVSNQD